jgi:hypothetical protein
MIDKLFEKGLRSITRLNVSSSFGVESFVGE